MKAVFEDYLFQQHYLVATSDQPTEHACEALIALANFAKIRVTGYLELATLEMLKVAQRNIGCDVPEPFYRGFPKSVFELTPAELAIDQFLHYLRTYGLGDFSERGHSLFETYHERLDFDEDVNYKDFAIITPVEAKAILDEAVRGFLASTRPLSSFSYSFVQAYFETWPECTIDACASKDTAVSLLLDTRNVELASLIKLSDVIRMVEWLLERTGRQTLSKLNLRNCDRVFITAVIDRLFELKHADVGNCLEKRRVWCGILHHLHYKPTCDEARAFCDAIRNKDQRSAYSAMERCLAEGDVRGATDALRKAKGPGAVLRHQTDSERARKDIAYVLNACMTTNKIMLIQLMIAGASSSFAHKESPRYFKFTHLGKMRMHEETPKEASRRKSQLSPAIGEIIDTWLQDQFTAACKDTLGKVYVADEMKTAALPLFEASSMDGFQTLPCGTRIPLPKDKVIRAFTYWEWVDDIDLSCFLFDGMKKRKELSWRTMSDEQSEAITFSGDETSGYRGGSEYFDVFEPATVETSFPITCTSSMAYLFALDLADPALIWLNIARDSNLNVAGTDNSLGAIIGHLNVTDTMNVHKFASALATEVVDTVEEAGRKIAERQQQLDNALEACDSEIKEAAAALAALEGSLERIRTQSAEQRTTLENAQHKLQEFLDEHGLSNRSELEEIIRTDPKTVENSRIQYQNKKDELNAAAGAVENVTGRVEELARQNNELLSQFEPAAVQDDHLDSSWCDLQKQQQEELGRSLEQDKISRGQKTDLLARIATARREIKKLEDESYWISRLDELCRGSNLVNYVQDLVFTRLVEFANLHLARMIPRYTLKTDDKRRLSLILVDHNQASSERPVNTASGGEKFIVSLALAVSLADLSGTGVSVDTLFIDEGFGTLDRQNLDKVIKALESFHSRGKQIGIITHVDSIIDQMDAKIEVKRRNGSGFSEVFVPV